MTHSSSPEPVDLTDPAIEPLRLQQLAQTHPHLWNDILRHPNVYPGLTDWIHERQAEQAAVAPQAQYGAENVSHHETSDEPADDTDSSPAQDPTVDEPAPAASWFQHPSPQQSEHVEHSEPAGSTPQQQFSATSQQVSGEVTPNLGYGQSSYDFPQQQAVGYQQPQQPQYGQPYMPQSRGASKIDLSSRNTWGLFIAGGAAFLALFGFFFSPSVTPTSMFGLSHFSSGGWLLLLLLIATVAMAIIDLLLPNRWTRYAFVALGIGTAFALIGRYMTIMGFLDGYRIGFSLVWILFMALVLLAGTMVYFAPGNSAPASSPPQQQRQQYQPNPQFNQPGAYPPSGQFPQGGYGQEPQQFGGYQPPQRPGSPQ